MTMDYHRPYNVFQEYYCPPYQGAGYQYQQQVHQNSNQQQHLQHQHSMPGPLRNFNNNIIGPPPVHHHHHESHPQQQQSQPYFASFQQHNQHQQRSNYPPYVPNFLVSSGSGLTPTLTPTTLATIEQSFIELQSGQQNGVRDPVTQSGFVPPVVDPGHSADVSQDSMDYSSDYSDSEWEPQAKQGRMLQDMRDMKNVDLIVTSNGTINATPQRKYTRRNKDEKLAPEEEERRRVRRERNKVAAAKCRQRRVDHTNELVEETEKLEAEQSQLESEIQNLQQEKDQLEFILQAHQPLCKVDPSRPPPRKIKMEPGSRPSGCGSYSHASHDTSCPVPENLSMSASSVTSSAATCVTTTSYSQGALDASVISSRPNSLPLIKRDRARMLSLTSATGVTINTPTSGVTITPSSLFCPGLDSMVDGSTGLTPLTGMSCSSQVQRNSSDSGSEAVGSPTLISL